MGAWSFTILLILCGAVSSSETKVSEGDEAPEADDPEARTNTGNVCPASETMITVKKAEWEGGSLRVEWSKLPPGNGARITVMSKANPVVAQKSYKEQSVLFSIPPCQDYLVKAELTNGNDVIHSAVPMAISARYPVLDAPSNLAIEAVPHVFAHRITWTPPLLSEPACSEMSYSLEQIAQDGAKEHKTFLPSLTTEKTIMDLIPNTVYQYKVKAILNAAYEGPSSGAEQIVTLPVPSKPTEPSISWTATGLLIDWTGKLNAMEQIERVKILHTSGTQLTQHNEEATVQSVTLNVQSIQCESRVLYAVENVAGKSEFISLTIPTRLPLPVPGGLRVQPELNNLAHWVTWNPVEDGCGIHYRVVSILDGRQETVSKTRQTNVFISDAEPGKLYTYAVQTVGMNNETSAFSTTAEFETPTATKMEVTVNGRVTGEGISVEWRDPGSGMDSYSNIVFFVKEGIQESLLHHPFGQYGSVLPTKSKTGPVELYAAVQNAAGLSPFTKVTLRNKKLRLGGQ
ncbi:collagen type XII alpha [Clonorchis sinensis]|uniref:Collagen type XII alpha n=1 Tax=Clonorchis sinensis TaxID=79923 RepID=H2KPF5_CLOSI|nr:collagen type XII alpha [Clonorchis sinensis]